MPQVCRPKQALRPKRLAARMLKELAQWEAGYPRQAAMLLLPEATEQRHVRFRGIWTIAGRRGVWRRVRRTRGRGDAVEPGRVVARCGPVAAEFVRLVDLEALVREAVAPRQEATATAAV